MGIARKAGLQFDFRERRCGYFNKTSKETERIKSESTGVPLHVWKTNHVKSSHLYFLRADQIVLNSLLNKGQ